MKRHETKIHKVIHKSKAWYLKWDSWIWRSVLALGVVASMWMHQNFVSQEIYWKNYRENNAEIQNLRERVVTLEERNHR